MSTKQGLNMPSDMPLIGNMEGKKLEDERQVESDRQRAEIFDALGHPTRILILKVLSEGSLGFADLKKKTAIESSGHLQHHLTKLNGLIKTDEYGKYGLSEQGKDALLTVQTVENLSPRSNVKEKARRRRFGHVLGLKSVAFLLMALLIASSAVAVYEYYQITILTGKASLNGVSSSSAKLNNAGYLSGSKLYLISANASYETINGKACLVIDATVRNDYTSQEPPPMDNSGINSTGTAYFGLTAILYEGHAIISSEDVTSIGSAPLGVPQNSLESGQTAVIQIDMATSNHNVDSYSINLLAIAGYPIP
jgi:DNA-binding HxlR family transcriptional regulator